MKILFFDTETSGLQVGRNVILQLSYQIVETSDWSVVKSANHYFPWPEDSLRVDEHAIEVNGLTQEFLSKKSLSDKAHALQEFIDDRNCCDLCVAHNLEFDKKFIIEECHELGIKYSASGWPDSYDTMKKTTNLCCLYKSWGSGYKYPKLSELANFLGIDVNNLRLHDSSEDVELTKQCFRQLLAKGYYTLPQKEDTGISMKLHVEDEKDYTITYFDDNGNTFDEEYLVSKYGKKNIINNKKQLIEIFCTTTNETNEQTRYAFRATPDIIDISSFQEQLKNLKPSTYAPAIFGEPEPQKDTIAAELMEEAKKVYNSILFWTNAKKRKAYVEENLDIRFNRSLQIYMDKKASFDKDEAEKKIRFDKKASAEYEDCKRVLEGLLNGDVTILNEVLTQTPEYSLPLLGVTSSAKANSATEADVELRLPRFSELPKVYGARLASGAYKIKNYSDKELHAFYADYAIGMAFYMAASYLNMAPTLKEIHVAGFGVNEVTLKEERIYDVTLSREDLSSMNRQANAIDAIEVFPHKMALSKSFVFKPI